MHTERRFTSFSLCLNKLMNNLLFSLSDLGTDIVNGLVGTLGKLWYLVLINFIGVLAIVCKVIETQNKKRNVIVFLAVLNYLLWILYFLLNGDITAATVNTISCIQAVVFLQRSKHKWANSIFWLIFFICVQIGASFFTWNGPFSLFSIGAGILSTIAYYVLDEKLYRYFFLALILLWIGNGIVYFYPIALAHDIFAAISITIAIIRYNFKKEESKKVLAKEQNND